MTTEANILTAIRQAETIAIVSHKSPDGDSIGSSLAMYHLLKKWGKNVTVVHPDPAPEFLHWLEGQETIVDWEKQPEKAAELLHAAELVICLDFNEPGRVGNDMKPALESAPGRKIMIDHHLHPADFCEYVISRPEICSTAQLIYEWLEAAGELASLDEQIGNCIYLGMMTDTGSFRFPSVSPKTHEILAHLLKIGVQHFRIHEQVYDTNTIDRIRLRGFALSEKLVCLPNLPVAYVSLSAEELERFHYQKGDTEGLVNQILGIKGISMAVLFMEKDNKVKISFRSKGNWKVNELASAHFAGGGHMYASGGASDDSLERTIERFVTIVPEYVPSA